ncbi:GGDEF domain-containing protein [Bacillus sp. DTU_2020_1000418_1_SI_GHA_SEK_038]|uniref:GGDEF domain-containing protein n=1 Tax=Bacillus sp. DTU_2020_1000418_1_SI_GHA_SEK_038 TaxID=3077585 RepID=UPI0028E319C6|nr:GGDEF domain-containing protein [Bacillus sp. DTU_2020_1000418_1_SI_GHA_SEK_038]WNS76081.1 GGDEF domain-containing protein [Bacillus sp. DTU_2020_1000418_1_SI_GHA_SEK_038]
MHIVIGEISQDNVIVAPSTLCEVVYSIFTEDPSLEGIVVCNEERPIGLVMRTHFFQKLSTKYGFDLFMKRTIELVMEQEFLMVEYSVPITEVSALAMGRKQEHLYDYVIITKQDRIHGVVSIRELIIKLSEIQITIARFSNPLSGLPGNNVIEETLNEVLSYKRFSVFYIDIDLFKSFNDTFGFSKGDELINETAKIIKKVIDIEENAPSFVGHIGGDDFIAVIPHYSHEPLSRQIITLFEHATKRYYSEDEWKNGRIQARTRQGQIENIPLVTISIAIVQNKNCEFTSVEEISKVAARIKSICKAIKESVFLTLEDVGEEEALHQ